MEIGIPTQVTLLPSPFIIYSENSLASVHSRNRVPWIVNAVVFGGCAITLLVLRAYLSWENKRREAESRDDVYDDVYLTHVDEKGNSVQTKVDRVGALVSVF